MLIKQELLDYVFNLLAQHQPETIYGEYDGDDGFITMTFVDDPGIYTVDFSYTGVEYNVFRELLCNAGGEAVKLHNAAVGIPSRDAFIESVTESD